MNTILSGDPAIVEQSMFLRPEILRPHLSMSLPFSVMAYLKLPSICDLYHNGNFCKSESNEKAHLNDER